jgi:hypothetical protein
MNKRSIVTLAAGVVVGGAIIGIPAAALASSDSDTSGAGSDMGTMMNDPAFFEGMKTLMSDMMSDSQMQEQMRSLMEGMGGMSGGDMGGMSGGDMGNGGGAGGQNDPGTP